MLGDDVIEFLAGLLDLLGRDHNVRSLTLGASERLMDQHPGMRQAGTLALLAGAKQDRTHRGRHSRTDRGHVGLNKLHRVIDGQT